LCYVHTPAVTAEERSVVRAAARTMGDTDADREPAFGPAPAGCDAASNALGQRPGIAGLETIGDNDEFPAAETVGEIRHANRRDHVQHNALQDTVTGGVTEPIIELLEVIDIDEQQR